MIPLLVQPISSEESTNTLPVPWIRFLRCRFHGIDRLVHATVLAVTARRSPQQDHQHQNRRQQQRPHAQENELPMGIDHVGYPSQKVTAPTPALLALLIVLKDEGLAIHADGEAYGDEDQA